MTTKELKKFCENFDIPVRKKDVKFDLVFNILDAWIDDLILSCDKR